MSKKPEQKRGSLTTAIVSNTAAIKRNDRKGEAKSPSSPSGEKGKDSGNKDQSSRPKSADKNPAAGAKPAEGAKPPERSKTPKEKIEAPVASPKDVKLNDKAKYENQPQVTVSIQTTFVKITEVNTTNEYFSAEVFVRATWREKLLDKTKFMKPDDPRWEKLWNPKLIIENTIEKPEENIWKEIVFKNGQAYICERREVVTNFFENMEVDQFPFDSQEVTVTVGSERPIEEVLLVEDDVELSVVDVHAFTDEDSWYLYNYVIFDTGVLSKNTGKVTTQHSCTHARCHVSRKWTYYFWNVYLFLFCFAGLTFAAYSLPYWDVNNRMAMVGTMILTQIQFKNAIKDDIPSISYLTYLDIYMIGLLFLMTFLGIWFSILNFMMRGETVASIEHVDSYFVIIVGGLYFVSLVLYWIMIYVVVLRKQRKFVVNEKHFLTKVQKSEAAKNSKKK